MFSWEYGSGNDNQPVMLGDNFSVEEIAQLAALREHFQIHPQYWECGIDDRRLEFARWLVQHGKLNEGIERVSKGSTGKGIAD